MPFQIKLLQDDKNSIANSRKEIIEQTRQFTVRLLDHVIRPGRDSSGTDQRPALLARDLLTGRFWGVLSCVDGTSYEVPEGFYSTETREGRARKNETIRVWARNNFSHFELEEILNLAVNQALLRPYNIPLPGTLRGHSILYSELVEKEGSMFKEAVTADFRKRLNNGRFWEELPNAKVYLDSGRGIWVIKDVLKNHFADLDVDFAVPQGLDLMRFAADGRKLGELGDVGLKYAGETAVDKYAQFLQAIDENKKLSAESAEELLKPYLLTVLGWDDDLDDPYYNGEIDFDNIQRGKFQDKLKAPVLQKYLKDSPEMQKCAAKVLAGGIDGIGSRSNEYGQYSKFVREVLDHVPNPKAIMGLMMQELLNETGIRFFQKSEKHGQSLYKFMPKR